jgi:hypothetical protein
MNDNDQIWTTGEMGVRRGTVETGWLGEREVLLTIKK